MSVLYSVKKYVHKKVQFGINLSNIFKYLHNVIIKVLQLFVYPQSFSPLIFTVSTAHKKQPDYYNYQSVASVFLKPFQRHLHISIRTFCCENNTKLY